MSTFADQLFQFGGSPVGVPVLQGATYFFVDSTNGQDGNPGTAARPFATIQAAVDKAEDNVLGKVVIGIAPGAYDETVTISRPETGAAMMLIGLGPRGSVYIEPSTEDAVGMVCDRDDVTLFNVGVAAEDDTSATALTVTGSRFRAYQCKFEGGANQVVIGPGTVAQEAAGTKGNGADGLFEDCEFCWGTNGLIVQCTDYGGVTQLYLRDCHFHNLATKHITEVVGSGGAAAVTFFNFVVRNCIFDDLEDGTAPTNYIDLNANNANTGVVAGCQFPTAINSGLNLVSTAMHWVSNFHTGGVSTAQPS